ncbi:MAG: hypothetical protein ACXVA9_07675 [Bdellovibrionales bacterium]
MKFEDDIGKLHFEQRFHLLHLHSCNYCFFVSKKGLHYLVLGEEEIALARKIKTQEPLSREEKVAALALFCKLAVQPASA